MKRSAIIRFLSLSLIAAMLVSFVSACDKSSGDDAPDDGTETSAESVTETEKPGPALEREDNGGAVFTTYSSDRDFYRNYFFTDEQNGDAMNDALYNRDKLVEDYLGVKIEHILNGTINDVMPSVQKTVMSGDDEFQLALTHCYVGVAEMATKGYLYDWNDLNYCDYSQKWWNQDCIENLTVNGKNYYMVSDFVVPDMNCILFNKQMIDEFSLENPYTLVDDGKWTLDKLSEMASKVTSDINGDGVFDINDRYGLAAPGDWYWCSFLHSSGIKVVSRNDKGNYELSIGGERAVSMVEKLDQLVNRSGDTFLYSYLYETDGTETLRISTGRCLFQVEAIFLMNTLRGSTVEYGILPYPKLDEAQADYYSTDWSGLMCIPKTVGNPDLVSKVCELLAYYSGDTALPAFYDLVLGEKLSRDEDSKRMLDVIFGSRIYDVGMSYFGGQPNCGSLFYTPSNLVINKKSADFASYYAKLEKGAQKEIEKFEKAIAELE